MILDYKGGRGGSNLVKSDYVISERSHSFKSTCNRVL